MTPHSSSNGWDTSDTPSFLDRTTLPERDQGGPNPTRDAVAVEQSAPELSRPCTCDIGVATSPRFRILVVHPQRHVADVLATILSPLTLDCDHAEGRAGVVERVGRPFSMMMLVVSPTAPDALELLAYSRQKQPWVQVLVLFTAPHPARAVEAIERGAAAVLGYPCVPQELRTAVSEVLHAPCPTCAPRCGCREFDDELEEHAVHLPRETPVEVPRIEPIGPVAPARAAELLLPHNRECTCLGALKEDLQVYERLLILRALRALDWDRQETARVLRIHRSTLYHKMNRYGLG
jgi:DNA-binding NtrC family response regulator